MNKTSTALFAALLMLASCSENKTAKEAEAPQAQAPKTAWVYSADADKMSGDTVFSAINISNDTLNFKPPYEGGSQVRFDIMGGKKLLIALQVSKGQFMPSVAGEETIRIKFDSEAPVEWSYSCTNNGNPKIIYFNNEKELLKKLRIAKTITVEPKFYQEGLKPITFDVENLEWKH